MGKRDERLKEYIRDISARLLNEQSNKTSLVTVTNVALTENSRKAIIFITVLPEDKEKEALSFARRQRTELRRKIIKELNISHPPFIEIDIDKGEKNRQRIDELSNKL